ncbi:MAG: MBOAT family O-acyltransferase [bacterium]
MQFNSIQFLIFFTVVVIAYFGIPHRFRWLLLVCASYFFYMWWKPIYIILIIISTIVDYYAGRLMGKTNDQHKRKKYLILSITVNLGLLFVFKYYNFFRSLINKELALVDVACRMPYADIVLPIGISFYTFQTIAYSVDIYRGHIKHESHFGIYSLYVAYFPQLVAGPIERAGNLISQLKVKNHFDYRRVRSGLQLMLWGFFKKIVIADRLAIFVDQVYNDPAEYIGISFMIATIFFAFQIYCDFSGYSDIAIGAAEVLGIKLMQNFRRPYFAGSVADFWRRWHISLSTWFRDYLYVPLGGSRVSQNRWQYNIMVTFILSGLWHGANWTFVVWGALHGMYMIFSHMTADIRRSIYDMTKMHRYPYIHKCIQIFTTFSLVCFAWIFFRARSISEALFIISRLFRGIPHLLSSIHQRDMLNEFVFLSQPLSEFVIALCCIVLLGVVHVLQTRRPMRQLVSQMPGVWRWCLYIIAALLIMNLGIVKEIPFIYFQF